MAPEDHQGPMSSAPGSSAHTAISAQLWPQPATRAPQGLLNQGPEAEAGNQLERQVPCQGEARWGRSVRPAWPGHGHGTWRDKETVCVCGAVLASLLGTHLCALRPWQKGPGDFAPAELRRGSGLPPTAPQAKTASCAAPHPRASGGGPGLQVIGHACGHQAPRQTTCS